MAAGCRRATADRPPLTLRDEPRVALMALTTVASAEERAAAGRAPARKARTPSTTPPASSQGRRLRGGLPIRPRPAAREAGADMRTCFSFALRFARVRVGGAAYWCVGVLRWFRFAVPGTGWPPPRAGGRWAGGRLVPLVPFSANRGVRPLE